MGSNTKGNHKKTRKGERREEQLRRYVCNEDLSKCKDQQQIRALRRRKITRMIVAKSKGNIGIPGLSLLEGADNLSRPIGLGDVMDRRRQL